MEQVYKELEKRHDKALSRGLHIIEHRYSNLKKVVAIFGILLTLGTVLGLVGVRHEAKVRAHETCWSRHNNAVVLKALVNRTGGALDSSKIKSPELRQLLVASAKNGQDFKIFANKNISVPHCGGKNPHPLTHVILKLAHEKQ